MPPKKCEICARGLCQGCVLSFLSLHNKHVISYVNYTRIMPYDLFHQNNVNYLCMKQCKRIIFLPIVYNSPSQTQQDIFRTKAELRHNTPEEKICNLRYFSFFPIQFLRYESRWIGNRLSKENIWHNVICIIFYVLYIISFPASILHHRSTFSLLSTPISFFAWASRFHGATGEWKDITLLPSTLHCHSQPQKLFQLV